MDYNFEEYKVQGTKFNYYFVCKRKLWLFSKGISMEDGNDKIQEGKIAHEYSYKNKEKNKEKLVDELIKIDIVEKDEIREVKLSSKMKDSDRMQLLYYLFYLKQLGINKKGTLNYVKERKKEEVILKKEDEIKIVEVLKNIKIVLNLKYPPKVEKFNYCKKCSYYEYCYIKEEE
ncbi:CRISPR-associated protein Cas4 [Clostridium botulinum]|uniref:CRISPR-associated protein Cas4 n=1 Tax=Clostridium TaxID=1485 RepID=UPI0013EEB872|nr:MULTISPECIES: CRISPR-associated protein Cas4 [Clostridium]MBZ9691841.1 CRISPR-associated protein Cas4 [Clostridium sp. M14]NFS29243.1 CRISPR-associated protein Cas4 [Clostridium botulinum]NFS53791.1 CRISPR-associated protein Cas4 [Clostridium botulinum]NFT06674.1 CRISPR-associated protein Cas4 [Clostridium botulinum]NFT17229.1 CRISPR-associated protein Cas4 [Clostridium botulinum]